MPTGIIRRLVKDRGFGFIRVEGSKDLFFHRSDVLGGSFETLREGDKVRFDVREDPRGPRAIDVTVTE